ncbi:MAG: TRAP transporter small permease [Dehalococcoidales bacterium]|nr:TRAP transporter small permease [Dehalococcoidales bacterium]
MLRKTAVLAKKIINEISKKAIVLMTASLMLQVLVVVVDVIMRRLFNNPLGFNVELMELSLLFVVWGAVLFSHSRGRQIGVDMVVSNFPNRLKKIIVLCGDALSMIMMFLIGYQTIFYTFEIKRMQKVSDMLEIPTYPFVFFVAIVAIFIGLVLMVKLIDDLKKEAGR